MLEANPFDSPEFKRLILAKEGRTFADDTDNGGDFEIVSSNNSLTDDVKADLRSIISSAPVIPKKAKNVILDASAIAKNERDAKALEINVALNDVFSRYNKTYGTDLQIDFSNLSRTLVNVSDPLSRHTLELYLSEVFLSIRPILILHMIAKLSVAIDYILDPKRMFDSSSMSIQDTFIAVEKIMQFILQLEDMKDEIVIKGSDLELKKLADELGNDDLNSEESRKVIDDFMALFKKDSGLE